MLIKEPLSRIAFSSAGNTGNVSSRCFAAEQPGVQAGASVKGVHPDQLAKEGVAMSMVAFAESMSETIMAALWSGEKKGVWGGVMMRRQALDGSCREHRRRDRERSSEHGLTIVASTLASVEVFKSAV